MFSRYTGATLGGVSLQFILLNLIICSLEIVAQFMRFVSNVQFFPTHAGRTWAQARNCEQVEDSL